MPGHDNISSHEREVAKSRGKYRLAWEKIKSFKEQGRVQDLIEAYVACDEGKLPLNFVGLLKERLLEEDLRTRNMVPREFPEFEYEVKLNVEVKETKGRGPEHSRYLEKLLGSVSETREFLSDGNARVVEDGYHDNRSVETENMFFRDDSDNEMVLVSGNRSSNIKYKRPEKISPGDPNMQFVTKRAEEVSRYVSSNDVAKAILEFTSNGGRLIGEMFRRRALSDVISANTGRIYTVVLDTCYLLPKRDVTRRQVEIEYVGYLPGPFAGFTKDSEPQITNELVDLMRRLQEKGRNLPVGYGWEISRLVPTKERKIDFFKDGE